MQGWRRPRAGCVLVVLVACGSSKPRPPDQSEPIPMCVGQTADPIATARTGEMPLQLAPSFLDRMPACGKPDATPPADLVTADAGTVNAKGDCEWTNRVACHFHVGAEFVTSGAPRPQEAELHCIFPTVEPKSPRVFGAHFTCKAGTAITHGHDKHPGEACGLGLLSQVSSTLPGCDARCCDDGTLTTTTAERRAQSTLDVRPDFRICSQTIELDCATIASLTGHAANAPAFGAPIEDGL